MGLTLQGFVNGENRTWQLANSPLRAGRSSSNGVQLLDGTVSKEHAEFLEQAGRWTVRDLSSRNGTRVNGVDATAPHSLAAGDTLEIGHVLLRVSSGEEMKTQFSDSKGLGSSMRLRVADVLQRSSENTSASMQLVRLLSKAGALLVLPRPLRETCEELLKFVEQAVPASRFVMLLRDKPGTEPVPIASRRAGGRAVNPSEPLALSQTIMRTVLDDNTAVITSDALNDPRFMGQNSIIAQAIHSAMAVPLFDNQQVLGVLYVDSTDPRVLYAQEQLELLTLLGNMAAVKITNARLIEADSARQRLEQELSTATRIQEALLPPAPTDIPGWTMHARLETCYEVGGDLYDFHRRDDGTIVVMQGDVSGKGMGAALLMSSILSTARVLYDVCDDPLALIRRLNAVTFRSTDARSFVTMFVGYIDADTGKLRYVNAGHPEPHLSSGGVLRTLEATGIPVGMMPDFPWTMGETTLEHGEVMALFTDGIPEAQCGPDFFDFERVAEAMQTFGSEPELSRIADGFIERIDTFAAGEHRADDVTLVLVRRD